MTDGDSTLPEAAPAVRLGPIDREEIGPQTFDRSLSRRRDPPFARRTGGIAVERFEAA